jgi:hypothetical protein
MKRSRAMPFKLRDEAEEANKDWKGKASEV